MTNSSSLSINHGFYLLNYKIWVTLEDQNQGRPWATERIVH